MRRWMVIVLGLAAVVIVALGVEILNGGGGGSGSSGPNPTADRGVVGALAAACKGQGVPGSGALATTGAVRNHLVVLDTRGQPQAWTDLTPVEWRPIGLSDAELVACIPTEDSVSVEQVCRYSGDVTITKYDAYRTVEVFEAASGKRVASFTVTDAPYRPECAESVSQFAPTEERGVLEWPAVQAHLASLVERGVYASPTWQVSFGPTTSP